MARDVDDALLHIVSEHGRMSPAKARLELQQLAADRRHCRNVSDMGIAARPTALQAARMGPLAVLPVFFALSGRRVIVAGNGAAAAWKAELLAAAGAEVMSMRPRRTKRG